MDVKECLLASIQKRWLKTDQDSFILAVILNPYIPTTLFKKSNTYATSAGVYGLVRRLWARFFPRRHDSDLFDAALQYYDKEGIFTDDAMLLEDRLAAAKNQVCPKLT